MRQPNQTIEYRRQNEDICHGHRRDHRDNFQQCRSQVIVRKPSAKIAARAAKQKQRKQHNSESVDRMTKEQNELLYHRYLDDDETGAEAAEVNKIVQRAARIVA